MQLILSEFIKSFIKTRAFIMLSAIARIWRPIKILGHYDKNPLTYLVLQNTRGDIFHETVLKLASQKFFWKQLSKKDAYLYGYLLGAEQEKLETSY